MNKRDSVLILLLMLIGPAYYFTADKTVDPVFRDAIKDTPAVEEPMPGLPGDDFRDALRDTAIPSAPGIIEEGRPEKMPPLERRPDIGERFTREAPETPEVSPSSPQ